MLAGLDAAEAYSGRADLDAAEAYSVNRVLREKILLGVGFFFAAHKAELSSNEWTRVVA